MLLYFKVGSHQNQLLIALCFPSLPAPTLFMYATRSFNHCGQIIVKIITNTSRLKP